MRTSDPSVALAMVEVAARALDETDPDEATDLELSMQLRVLWRGMGRLRAQFTRRLAVWHRRGGPAREGAASTAAWLRHRLRMDATVAERQVDVALALDDLPATAVAYRQGAISFAHTDAVVAASRDLGPSIMSSGGESMLVERGKHEAPAAVRRLAGRLRQRMDPARTVIRQRHAHDSRWLTVERTTEGAVALRGLLDPVGGEVLVSTVDGRLDRTPDGRTPAQRRADALVAALGCPHAADAAPRPRVTVTMTLAALRAEVGHAAPVLGSGEPVGAAAARRLACDAEVIPAVLGSLSEPLDIGRATATVPDGLRHALCLRDGGCRFPGCERPAAQCLAHHVRHWADGGATALDNLVLLCDAHHGMVHEGGWRLARDTLTREVVAWRPDGTPFDAVSPPPERSAWG
jgi:hypothetical protein